jgi:hypothetical protein
VDIDAGSLQDALRSLHELTGANLLLSGPAATALELRGGPRVRLNLRDVTLGEALDALVWTAPPEVPLGYTVERSVIVVTTRVEAEGSAFSRAYDIRDWLAASRRRDEAADDLCAALTKSVAPETWRDSGGELGMIKVADGFLVVTQTRRNHDRLRRTLDSLRAGAWRRASAASAETGPSTGPADAGGSP